jgi:hypothetical protein
VELEPSPVALVVGPDVSDDDVAVLPGSSEPPELDDGPPEGSVDPGELDPVALDVPPASSPSESSAQAPSPTPNATTAIETRPLIPERIADPPRRTSAFFVREPTARA